jgi:hypothetical protein
VRPVSEIVAAGDLDELIRLIDGLCASRQWDEVIDVRDRCRHALEQRGLQLWPAAEYAEYRLALDAPGSFAGGVVTEKAGRFALGPLWEVAASRLSWTDLSPFLAPGPARALAAHERVVRGEDLSNDDTIDDHVLEIPLRLMPWEPQYPVAVFKSDSAEFDAPPRPDLRPVVLPPAGVEIDDDEAIEALIDIGAVWSQQSNGSVRASAVEGTAEQAIASLGHATCVATDVDVATAFALVGWAGASGGAYGRRRGTSTGRFIAWWLVASLADLGWPAASDEVGSAAADLRWVVWEPIDFTGGWSGCVAIESPEIGLSWAVEALDSWREGDGDSPTP